MSIYLKIQQQQNQIPGLGFGLYLYDDSQKGLQNAHITSLWVHFFYTGKIIRKTFPEQPACFGQV